MEIGLPEGSDLRTGAVVAELHCTGRLGSCRVHTGVGDVRLSEVGPVQVKCGQGDIAADHAHGHVELTTAAGEVRVARIDGSAEVKNSSGNTWIGSVSGDLRVVTANGTIAVDHALANVTAKTAHGDIRLGELAGGEALAQTASGTLTFGVREGVAAWLDLDTSFGTVDNRLEAAARPGDGETTVAIRARTAFGDITVHRVPPCEAESAEA